MKTNRSTILCCLLVLCSFTVLGCGKKADENKPLDEVKAEAEKMNTSQLRSMANTYKNAIMAKKAEAQKVAAKLKEIPVTKLLGEEAKELKTDIENLNKSVSALKQRFEAYYDKLKEKGGDLSGLEL